ncbi:hypothetical protein PoB_006730500 [Plakobranchus ocellatus]|uniref:Uncharacterized protein n=1 Tax=Plakobranchus ocellatus TaxID=259542 RepID=A0AAV4DA17_9GAST|nr:hypothetical protein PoB_006730500 [Plakobranchus ocellatus]
MAPMYQRESIHQRQSLLVASYDSHSTVSRFLPRFHSRRKRSKEQQEEGREEKSKVEKSDVACNEKKLLKKTQSSPGSTFFTRAPLFGTMWKNGTSRII